MSVATNTPALQPAIQSRILSLRGQRVMLDADLALLYGVETRVLIQAIKRNATRFPADFMFQLTAEEFANLRSQFVISSLGTGRSTGTGYGGRRYAPYAFTEQGVAMLSTVLNSERAVIVNIDIMRTFVRVRELSTTQQDLAQRLAELEMKNESLDMRHSTFKRNTRLQLKKVFDTLRELMTPPETPKRPIGFVHSDEVSKPKPKPESKAIKASKGVAVKKVARKK
jgi:hypothetical protein